MKLGTLKIIFVIVGFFFVLQAFAEAKEGEAALSSSCSSDGEQVPGLNESRYVQIGGIKQWIAIKGENCSNPVILLVHGGPGNPLSLYHDSLFKRWESQFTIVHWDQRGSGKTYEKNQEVGELTIERLNKTKLTIDLMVQDGLEVTDYIRKKLGKEKIILSGTSWGSVLGVKMAFIAPGKYHFYVGVSQLVNSDKNSKESYDLVMSIAEGKRDEESIAVLNSIGSPPWTNPRSFGKLRRIIREYENQMVSDLPEPKIEEEYLSPTTRAAYFSGEEFSFIKFVGFHNDGMAQQIALDECCTEFEIPIYLVQGENDLLTVPGITKKYFNSIKAPRKEYFLIKQSGHDPNLKVLDKQLDVFNIGMGRLAGKSD